MTGYVLHLFEQISICANIYAGFGKIQKEILSLFMNHYVIECLILHVQEVVDSKSFECFFMWYFIPLQLDLNTVLCLYLVWHMLINKIRAFVKEDGTRGLDFLFVDCKDEIIAFMYI